MADYVGETYRITVEAQDFNAEAVSPSDIDSMYVQIWDADDAVVVAETEMIWNSEEELWYYVWETSVASTVPGKYKFRCRLLDLDTHSSWEYGEIRLKANPVPL